jgi:hypothetical protein
LQFVARLTAKLNVNDALRVYYFDSEYGQKVPTISSRQASSAVDLWICGSEVDVVQVLLTDTTFPDIPTNCRIEVRTT